MHPLLPVEILEKVVDYCSGIPYTLCNLSLTCRQLLPRTRYHLFASIMIKGADLQRLYSFCDALNAHPKLGSLIRSVTFVVDTGMSERRVQPSLLEIVPVVVLCLPRLRWWEIVEIPSRGQASHYDMLGTRSCTSLNNLALATFRKYGTTIRTLSLRRVCYLTCQDFMRFLSSFRALRDLCCEGITFTRTLARVVDVAWTRGEMKRLQLTRMEVSYIKAAMHN